MNKHNNNFKSYPGKGIAVGNNCLDKTPFVPRSWSLLEWWATRFGDRCLLTGVLKHEQLRRVGGWSWPTFSWPLRGSSRSPGGGALSAHPAIMGTPDLWDKVNPLVL